MNRQTSVYLDLVRFMAAITVFFAHLGGQRLTGGLFWQVGPYGNEAVDIFFVLSGFVIAYVSDRSETDLGNYAVARLARVYSVALPALVVTFSLDALGRWLRADLYSSAWGYVADGQAAQFFSSLFFVNRLWWSDIKQGSNIPYWSLSYEIWYYIIFAAAFFAPHGRKMIATLAAICIAGPCIVVLFPLWLMGVGCYHIGKRYRIGTVFGSVLCLGPIVLWLAYEFASWRWNLRLDHQVPARWFDREQLVQDYLVAPLFAVHLAGFNAISHHFSLLNRFAKAIRWAAGATFTIYLFHLPVAQFLAAIDPWPASSWQTRIALMGGTLGMMFLIAEATERRKDWWRNVFASLLTPSINRMRAARNRAAG